MATNSEDQFEPTGSAGGGDGPTLSCPPKMRRGLVSLREYLGLATILMLVTGLVTTALRLRSAEAEVSRLRAESGYLVATGPGQIAAARAPSDEPLTYRVRIRTPATGGEYRVAYSTYWPRGGGEPEWYSAIAVPAGESQLTVRIHEDPRDQRWKVSAIVTTAEQTRRMATTLPPPHVAVFRGSHQVVSTGVGRQTLAVDAARSIRLLDERWLVGGGQLLLYGDRPPEQDQIGVYAELQPDVGPL